MESEYVTKILDIFADDLYRYLFPRRINIEYCREPIEGPEDLPVFFNPHIGMSVLCESERRQQEFMGYFATHYPKFVKDNRSFMTFCATYALKLCSEIEDNPLEASIIVSSMILELGVFCHIRGHKHLKYFSGICWTETFKHFIAPSFFNSHGWGDLIEFASDDAKTYMEGGYEICFDDDRVEFRTEWLRKYDYWVSRFVPAAETDAASEVQEPPSNATKVAVSSTESAIPDNGEENSISTKDGTSEISKKREIEEGKDESADNSSIQVGKNVDSESVKLAVIPESTLDSSIQIAHEIDSEPFKLTIIPEFTPVQKTENELLAKFKSIICEEESSSELLKILDSEREANELMNNDVFLKLVTETLGESEDRLKNENILELSKILLLGNHDLGRFYIKASRYIALTNTIGSLSESCELTPELSVFGDSSTLRDVTSNPDASLPPVTKSSKLGAIPKRKRSVAKVDIPSSSAHAKLLEDFKRVISAGGNSVGLAIYEILESADTANLLLNNDVFRSMMNLTVKFPSKRWGNQWILSFAKSLINASRVSYSVDEHSAQTSDSVATETSEKRDSLQKGQKECTEDVAQCEASGQLIQVTQSANVSLDSERSLKQIDNAHATALYDADGNLYVLDPDDDPGEFEYMKSVYVDIVDLNNSLKRIMVNALEETNKADEYLKDSSQGSLTKDPSDTVAECLGVSELSLTHPSDKECLEGATQGSFACPSEKSGEQSKEKSKKKKKKNKRNKRSADKSDKPTGTEETVELASNSETDKKRDMTRACERLLACDAPGEKKFHPIYQEMLRCLTLKEDPFMNLPCSEALCSAPAPPPPQGAVLEPAAARGNRRSRKSSKRNSKSQSANSSQTAFSKVLDLMPIPFSPEISDWIYNDMKENDPKFLEILENKTCLDEATMNEVMEYHDKFYEMKEDKGSSECTAVQEESEPSVSGKKTNKKDPTRKK